MAPKPPKHEVTELLQQWRDGDSHAHERLLALVYDELRRVARARLRSEARDHTLQPTALVHEAYLRLLGARASPQNRAHLFAMSARLMRQVLVDHARRRKADKRGSGATTMTLTDAVPSPQSPVVDLLVLDEALTQLGELDERLSQVVELKCFGGLSIAEMASSLNVSAATVERDWAMAKAWLFERLSSPPPA